MPRRHTQADTAPGAAHPVNRPLERPASLPNRVQESNRNASTIRDRKTLPDDEGMWVQARNLVVLRMRAGGFIVDDLGEIVLHF